MKYKFNSSGYAEWKRHCMAFSIAGDRAGRGVNELYFFVLCEYLSEKKNLITEISTPR